MLKRVEPPSYTEEAHRREQRLREAIALHEIEGNPLTAEQIAQFEAFNAEGWPDEQALTRILQRHQQPA